MTDAKTLIAPYLGKTWLTQPDAAAIFQHVARALPVRFYKASTLRDHLAEEYSDEMTFRLKAAEDGEWTDDNLVPIAAVGYDTNAGADDDEFIGAAFAYLMLDARAGKVLYATTDNWNRSNVLDDGLAALGLTPAG